MTRSAADRSRLFTRPWTPSSRRGEKTGSQSREHITPLLGFLRAELVAAGVSALAITRGDLYWGLFSQQSRPVGRMA